MINVVVVDDHPALQAGLQTVLNSAEDIALLETAASAYELWPMLKRSAPDVVLLDYHLPGDDGLVLCHKIKMSLLPPQVILYSAYADASLAVPAVIAGADGLVNKGASAQELLNAIRQVADKQKVMPPIPQELIENALKQTLPEQHKLFDLLTSGTSSIDARQSLGLDLIEFDRQVEELIGCLKVEVPRAGLEF